MMTCAGLIEGSLTTQRISDSVYLYKVNTLKDFGTDDWPDDVLSYIKNNMMYTNIISTFGKRTDPWLQHVDLVVKHSNSILTGYNKSKSPSHMNITQYDWWIYQSAGDMEDIMAIIELQKAKTGKNRYHASKNSTLNLPFSDQWYDVHHHCSGLIFATPGFTDVFVSHDSWSGLYDMNRIAKDYDFKFSDRIGGPKRMLFSSAPGRPYSMDDFWQIDNNLVVIETTIHNWNNELYEKYCRPSQIFTWIRVQVANRLSSSGQEWTTNFIRQNSGTYNNQYIVIDYNKFKPGSKPSFGFITAIIKAFT